MARQQDDPKPQATADEKVKDERDKDEKVDEAEKESFPASDPPESYDVD